MSFLSKDLTLLMLLLETLLSEAADCPYYYDKQPPQSITCDPFVAMDLTIVCKGCSSISTNFSIIWKGNDQIPNAMTSNSVTVSTNEAGEQLQCIESQLTITEFFLPDWYGDYFCQILIGNGSVLNPSTSVPLHPSPSGSCSTGTVFVTDEYACAVDLFMVTSVPTLTSTVPYLTSITEASSATSQTGSFIVPTTATQPGPSIVSTTAIPGTHIISTTYPIAIPGTHIVSTTNPILTPTVGNDETIVVVLVLISLSAVFSVIAIPLIIPIVCFFCCLCCKRDHVSDKLLDSRKWDQEIETVIKEPPLPQEPYTLGSFSQEPHPIQQEPCLHEAFSHELYPLPQNSCSHEPFCRSPHPQEEFSHKEQQLKQRLEWTDTDVESQLSLEEILPRTSAKPESISQLTVLHENTTLRLGTFMHAEYRTDQNGIISGNEYTEL